MVLKVRPEMLGEGSINSPRWSDPFQAHFLVGPTVRKVGSRVRREDRGELLFDEVRFQPWHLPDQNGPTGREIRASVTILRRVGGGCRSPTGAFHRLTEIATRKPGRKFSRSAAGFVERKGAMYLLFVGRFDSLDSPGKKDNDPNCALCDCRVSLWPLCLHKPL
jgi:hypothetical protein